MIDILLNIFFISFIGIPVLIGILKLRRNL